MVSASSSRRTDLADVHVVINSYGREAWYVERAIASVLRQVHRPAAIHFIDQNDTPLVLSPALRDEPLLRHHSFPDRRCSAARNHVLQLVPFGWIAFADDDAHWRHDYSEQLLDLLDRHRDVELFAGALFDEHTREFYSYRHKLGGDLSRFFGSKILYGANFVIRAETFAAIRGYELRLGPGSAGHCAEETDLCWRVITRRHPALYAPNLAILHPPMHTEDARVAARKAYRYGLGKGTLAAIWLFEKHHRYGLFEYLEMTLVPLGSLLRGLLRRDYRQLRIQPAQWWGRQVAFWTFPFRRGRASAP
ncbi:MAG: glycosyltransferase family 2 protein [Opitutaceae bacterium]|jgi:GT2 family glycosyltransferase|nr:glycosyltransferase family 2 protein [Opitutaceae bacterium]